MKEDTPSHPAYCHLNSYPDTPSTNQMYRPAILNLKNMKNAGTITVTMMVSIMKPQPLPTSQWSGYRHPPNPLVCVLPPSWPSGAGLILVLLSKFSCNLSLIPEIFNMIPLCWQSLQNQFCNKWLTLTRQTELGRNSAPLGGSAHLPEALVKSQSQRAEIRERKGQRAGRLLELSTGS